MKGFLHLLLIFALVFTMGLLFPDPGMAKNLTAQADYPAVPDAARLQCPFSKKDRLAFLHPGGNTITIQVTSTWFNRLVYNAALPEEQRQTWVINGPSAKEPLRPSGLLGPVQIKPESVIRQLRAN